MPRRSNDFQRLIAAIQVALAPEGFTVRESVELADVLTGVLREVDVLIAGTIAGGQDLRVAIECRDHARPATVEWIDQLYGKYRDLPVDLCIAVSRSGFTPNATEKGRKLRIGTLTLMEAADADWGAELPTLAGVAFSGFRTDGVSISLWSAEEPDSSTAAGLLHVPVHDLVVLDGAGRHIASFRDLWSAFLMSDHLHAIQRQVLETGATTVMSSAFLQLADARVGLPSGAEIPIEGIELEFVSEQLFEVGITDVQHASLGDVLVSHGRLKLPEGEARVVLTNEAGTVKIATAVWPGADGIEDSPDPQATGMRLTAKFPLRWNTLVPVEGGEQAADQTRDEIVAELDAVRAEIEKAEFNVVASPELELNSGAIVRRGHAVTHVRERDALELYDRREPHRFMATRHVKLEDQEFVVLALGEMRRGVLSIQRAYRIYGEGESLSDLSLSPPLAFAVFLERYGVPLHYEGRTIRFKPMLEVPSPVGELEMPGWLYETLGVRQAEQGETWLGSQSLMLTPAGTAELRWFMIVSMTRYETHVHEVRNRVT